MKQQANCITYVMLLAMTYLTLATGAAYAAEPDVFSAIRARGHINCGVSEGAVGFSATDTSRRWSGMNVDLCRALGAAMFGDQTKVEYIPLSSSRRFIALRSREIDILARTTAWTFSRDTDPELDFVGVYYHGGVRFLTRKSNGITSALELTGATVCLLAGSSAERAANQFFNRHGMKFVPVRAETWAELAEFYSTGRCLVIASDQVWLAYARETMTKGAPHILLPELIGAEMLGPMVLAAQPRWSRVVRWTMHGLVAAEEQGIKQSTVSTALLSKDPDVRLMLGQQGDIGTTLGLASDWLAKVISQVGNYGEIFERNLGRLSKLQLPRGRNELAKNGGVMVSPPFR